MTGLFVTGCSTIEKTDIFSRTKVIDSNPYLTGDGGASVYFIRPLTERAMGAADNMITVDINDTELLKIDKGEYTLVNLKPMENAVITTYDLTAWGSPDRDLITKSRSRKFTFVEGRTYFINLDMVDGEFRGVEYMPTSIDLETAKKLVKWMRPVGSLAQARPIESL